jgi:phenylacetate-CoA ligase
VFGGFSTLRATGLRCRACSPRPGPLYEPEGGGTRDYWRAGTLPCTPPAFARGDLVHNAFSYHMTPAGAFILESGAINAVGCTVLPGGHRARPSCRCSTMAELGPRRLHRDPELPEASWWRKAIEMGVATCRRSAQGTRFGGEACPPSLREWFTARGLAVYQSYATADLGMVAYETTAREGLVVDEGVIVEIVRPGTGDPVPEGEVGELVVTTLNPAYPLIRFGTGDLSAILPGICPTGRTAPRIKGWMGRADQTTKVRGMFVHPSQVADIARRFPQVRKARLVVSGEMANDQMCLRVEASEADGHLLPLIEAAVRDVTKLRAQVELVLPGSLPNDGKVIEDARSYQ